MPPAGPPTGDAPAARLFELITAHSVSAALHAVAQLRLADAFDGETSYTDLAEKTGSVPDVLLRLLRFLVAQGVVAESAPGRFALTDMGAYLRTDRVESLFAVALLHAGPHHQRRWAALADKVRPATGEQSAPQPAPAASPGAGGGNPFNMPPEIAAVFQQAMTFFTRSTAQAIVDGYDFAGVRAVFDVGGGHGTLLATLVEALPDISGVVFDLPEVAERAAQQFAAQGVGERLTAVGGDFFQHVPAGGDLYLLKNVLHDWDDEQATQILARCRQAMTPGHRLLIAESVMPDTLSGSLASRLAAMGDLNMLLNGGRERTLPEYSKLLSEAGFRQTRLVPIVPAWIGVESQLIEAMAI
ncbi:methyltransferase [Actinocrispum wychmicini]|uniref:O-methyltransferase n=1 Tax=Actinocrispum wychmicini TaxID=1213861 RepID=A0A4R2JPG0_9PSEU|nr:methyltransferase [Actinocrispum wychmicini]TCO62043.1 O-methyltransferase [Actinocrispum wychmicini]